MFEGKRILIVAAHPDDIEFGMGGTLHKLLEEMTSLDQIKCVVFSDTTNLNGDSIITELDKSLGDLYGVEYVLKHDIQNMNFVHQDRELRQSLHDLKTELNPDIIFSTSDTSDNTDHQILGKACLNVFQEQTVIFYEILRGDYNFIPNMYVKLSEEDLKCKQTAIRLYETQTSKRKYANDITIENHMGYRGSQIQTKFAECFEIKRILFI